MSRRCFSINDVFNLQAPGSPTVSPDGSVTAFTISETLVDENKSRSAVYVVANEGGGEPLLLVAAPASDPKFSPDGRRLSFTRGGQVWAVGLATGGAAGIQASGEPAQISNIEGGLGGALWADNSYQWSPDSAYIAVVARGVFGRGYDTTAPTDDANVDMLVAERTFYKWNAGWNPAIQTDGSYTPTHIWIVPTHIGGGTARCLTDGEQDDHSVTWSPDSTEICFVSNRTGDWDNNGNNSLFAVSIVTGFTRKITDSDGPEFSPVWSPDGEWIACLHSNITSKDSPAEDTAVCVVPAGGGPLTVVSTELDQRCRSPTWSHHSEWIYFVAGSEGNTHIYRVRKTGGQVVQVTTGERSVGSYALITEGADVHRTTGDGHNILACTVSSHDTPPELYRFGVPSGDAEVALTCVNSDLLATVSLSEPFELRYKSFDDTPIQGWVMPPYGGPPATGLKVPAVLMIHGGPHGSFGSSWSSRTHIFSGNGYAVIYLNPRGSTGYGQEFARGCVKDWGGGDFQDLMAGVDAAIAAHPWIDGERLGVFGGSYGGFMTMWAVTQTNRFKAAISHAGVSNNISFYGNSMYQLLFEFEFGGKPWEKYDEYWARSPMAYITNASTPMLITHGELDHDVPIGQSEEYYIALRKLGVPTSFVRYPRESHGIAEPQHMRDWMTRQLSWFGRWVRGDNEADIGTAKSFAKL